MNFIEGHFYHIYNRGNNHQKIFFNNDNYLFFLKKTRVEILPYCDILAYCLMPNHFHFLVHVKSGIKFNAVNNGIAVLLRSYTRAIHKQQNIHGSLFQQKTKAKELDDLVLNATMNQLSVCLHYIHQNPIRSGLVKKLEDWSYSSFKIYAGQESSNLCNKELAFDTAGIKQEEFLAESYQAIPEEYLKNYLLKTDSDRMTLSHPIT